MNEIETADCRTPRPYRLRTTIQHYNWGNRNDQAFIAHLLGITPEKDQPFAELWMGIHPNAPSLVIDPENGIQALSTWLALKPDERLNLNDPAGSSGELPYLFKVLSAGQALSIQAHPNKVQAKHLHQNAPQHYPDDNHKPEIAIAIDHLDALVGFISEKEFESLLSSTPELDSLLKLNSNEAPDLRTAVLDLLKLSQDQPVQVHTCISTLQHRLSQKTDPTESESLFLEQIKFSGTQDIGLLFLFFLNRLYLGPGEAVYLPPGVPHAYLNGNIIECMANSDNVVRLGLTKKYCDSQALSDILVFNTETDFRVQTTDDGFLKEYLSPTSEFRVKSLNLLQGESRAFSFRSTLTLFLLIEGEISLKWGTQKSSCICVYRRGNSFITPANLKQFSIQAKSHSKLFLVDIPASP